MNIKQPSTAVVGGGVSMKCRITAVTRMEDGGEKIGQIHLSAPDAYQQAGGVFPIAMSANAFEEDVEKSAAAGMNAHLSKPIEPQLLYATLARFLGGDGQ